MTPNLEHNVKAEIVMAVKILANDKASNMIDSRSKSFSGWYKQRLKEKQTVGPKK